MKQGIVFFIFIILSRFFQSCNTTEPPPPPDGEKPTLELTLEDLSCTEAWITLKTTNLQLPTTIQLKQDSTVTQDLVLSNADTLIYIDSLLPNKSYQYQTSSIEQPSTSNELSVTTMDTTSHDFTFETFTFGDISNSYLFDVAIISENNIWAVGEIRIADTSSIGYTKYNAVHWDGSEWTLRKIYYYGSCSAVMYPELRAIWAFSGDNIALTNGGSIGWFDGDTVNLDCGMNSLLTGSINKIWGTSSDDLYVVGNNGNIVHYYGVIWQKIESGTDVDFLDVWGTPDGNIVWVSGRDLNKTVLIKIEDQEANIVFEEHYPWQIQKGKISGGISSIWTDNENYLYATTPITVYRCLSNTNGEGKEIYPYEDYLYGGTIRIRGTGVNNIFTSGSNSSILHYNGYSWKRYEQFYDVNTYLYSSDTKGNLFVAVGDKLENILYYKAIIIVGW